MAPGGIKDSPIALQYGGNTSVVVIKQVKPVCFLLWILIKHPLRDVLQKKRQRTSYCQCLWRIGNEPCIASFKLQIILLPRQKPKFLLKFWEMWGASSCRIFSPWLVGVQLGMPWLRDEGAVGQASANQGHIPGYLMPN